MPTAACLRDLHLSAEVEPADGLHISRPSRRQIVPMMWMQVLSNSQFYLNEGPDHYAMSLCTECKSISTRTFGSERTLLFRHSHESFQKAVFESKCYICCRVWESLSEEQKGLASRPEFMGIKYYFRAGIAKYSDGEPSLTLASITFELDDDLYDCEDYNEVGGLDVESVGIFCALNPAVFPVQNAPRLADNTNSPLCWANVSKWIARCSTNHVACRESRDAAWRPTRLVDVDGYGNGYVRVVESSSVPQATIEPYLALSHCWGRKPFLVMDENNRETFEKGVLVSSLPLNFQDAILTTRRLGFRYIWIDSICIIQSSRDDWETEAPLMNKVYRNAFITLGAMASPDAHGGLFRRRDPGMASPLPVNIRTEKYGNVECLLIKSDFWHSHVKQAPMSQRGWVVQERILTPRSLYFCESQLFWECREQHACEWFPLGIPPIFVTDIKEPYADEIFSVKGFEKSVMRLCGADSEGGGDGPQQYDTVYQVWADVLESYLRCALTNPDDKFVAISGVVKDFAKAIDDEYIAGLWRRNLVNGLLWTARPEYNHEVNLLPAIRPDRYRAPSWSWASLDTPSMKAYHYWESQLFGEYVEVLDVHIEPKGSDPTGELRHACLHVSGHLIKTSRKPEYFDDAHHFGTFVPDMGETKDSRSYYCLPLREEHDRDKPRLRGLVVTRCSEDEKKSMTFCSKCSGKVVLRRVGTFVSDQGDPLRYLSMRKPQDWADWGEESDHLWFSEDADIWNIILV